MGWIEQQAETEAARREAENTLRAWTMFRQKMIEAGWHVYWRTVSQRSQASAAIYNERSKVPITLLDFEAFNPETFRIRLDAGREGTYSVEATATEHGVTILLQPSGREHYYVFDMTAEGRIGIRDEKKIVDPVEFSELVLRLLFCRD